jgi:hypothetical protein
MAGYSDTPLIKKLGIKEGFRILIVNSPKDFPATLGSLPNNVKRVKSNSKTIDFILLFSNAEKKLKKEFPQLARKLVSNGMLWVAWPKKSSGVETDLLFENVQRIGLNAGLVDVKICAVDDVWSGLKFVYRLKDRV